MSENRTNTDQFQLRLPPGLRDRIKAYAESKGRSTNAEIVRLLEREFPEPIYAETHSADLVDQLALLKNGATDESLDKLAKALEETILGIVDGRVRGIDESARQSIRDRYFDLRTEDAQNRECEDYDIEEIEQLHRSGNTKKFVDPDSSD